MLKLIISCKVSSELLKVTPLQERVNSSHWHPPVCSHHLPLASCEMHPVDKRGGGEGGRRRLGSMLLSSPNWKVVNHCPVKAAVEEGLWCPCHCSISGWAVVCHWRLQGKGVQGLYNQPLLTVANCQPSPSLGRERGALQQPPGTCAGASPVANVGRLWALPHPKQPASVQWVPTLTLLHFS